MVTPTIVPAGYGTATVVFDHADGDMRYYRVTATPASGRHLDRITVTYLNKIGDYDPYEYSETIANGGTVSEGTTQLDIGEASSTVTSIVVTFYSEDPEPSYELFASASVSPVDAALAGAGATATPSRSAGSLWDTVLISYDATDGDEWEFEKWSDGSTSRTHTVSYTLGPDRVMIVSLVAIFKHTSPPPPTYYIHASASVEPSEAGDAGCTASADPDTQTGLLGAAATVTYTASAASGWRFISWSDGSADTSHQVTYSFGPDEHKYVSLVAIFEEEKKFYNVVTVITPEDAEGTSSGDGTYEAGTKVTVAFRQKCSLWIFDRWEFSTGDTYYEKSVTFDVSEDVTCTAYFRHENTGQLIYDSDGSGDLIMGDGGSLLYNGDLVTA